MKYITSAACKNIYVTALMLVLMQGSMAQKRNLVTIGPVADVPISKTLGFSSGAGGSISIITPVNEGVAPLLSVSYLQYRYKIYRFPSGGSRTYNWETTRAYKITAGVMTKIGGNWYNIAEVGVLLERQNGQGKRNENQLVISTGPALLLPAGKNKVRIGLALGYSDGLFVNFGIGYGLKF
jgi:hypothetical protein